MEKIQIEVYSQTTNAPVVRMPGRAYPGVVIQGDSLHIVHHIAFTILERVRGQPDEELSLEASALRQTLAGFLQNSERVMQEHNLSLPDHRLLSSCTDRTGE
jgi:hypothetical protein